MTHHVRQVRNEQGNFAVFIVLVIVLAVVGLVSTWRWTERKIRESQEQSIPKEVFEAFVRFACPPDTTKLLVIAPDAMHPALGQECPAVYFTLALGDAKPFPRCVQSRERYVYGTALCAKREQVAMDVFTTISFKAPSLPTDSTRHKKRQ